MKRYEAMFLFDNTNVHQWGEMEAECRRLFERIDANVLVCVKFDERKLAYEINGRKRGTYVLTYFEADPQRIDDLERDGRLSELILRLLVLRAEKLSEAELTKLQAHPADQPLQPTSGDGRRGDGPRGDGPRGDGPRGDGPRGRSDSRDSGSSSDGDKGERGGEKRPRENEEQEKKPAAPADAPADADKPADDATEKTEPASPAPEA